MKLFKYLARKRIQLSLTLHANKNISTLEALFNNKAMRPRATGKTAWCDKFAALSPSGSEGVD